MINDCSPNDRSLRQLAMADVRLDLERASSQARPYRPGVCGCAAKFCPFARFDPRSRCVRFRCTAMEVCTVRQRALYYTDQQGAGLLARIRSSTLGRAKKGVDRFPCEFAATGNGKNNAPTMRLTGEASTACRARGRRIPARRLARPSRRPAGLLGVRRRRRDGPREK
jgi:ribosome modulation factor